MASCLTPYHVKNKIQNCTIPVPCGKCPECAKRRISGWSFRLLQEEKVSTSAYFLTLTYDTTKVPITRNGFMTLDKRDCQLFFKRLRKLHPANSNIKYYLAGEYGGKTKRPHYHIILFNADIKLIDPAWQMGQIHYGLVEGASVGYTLKYISKPSRIPMHMNDDRVKEFSLMSKGLGAAYVLNEKFLSWHHADLDNRMYCNIEGGKKIAMPRYYKEKIYTEIERKRIGFFARIDQIARQQKAEIEGGETYWHDRDQAILAAFRRQQFKNDKPEKL